MSWLIRTDVGGTFTDCVAVDPRGARHAAKVLSTGVLRARIGSVTDETIVLAGGWSDRLAVLAGGRAGDRVIRAVSGGTLTLGRGHGFSVGDAVELGTGEPAPILAARMVTRTPFGKPLPACDFRLATTRATN
ncbi:MAG: 5-oxoprolinase, partial [Planctomycetota bacterium]